MSVTSHHKLHGAVAQKWKGVDVAGTEKMRVVLPIPL
jgi:hypothetical protein